MTVPITVLESAKPGLFEFKLRFRGPRGGEIGEPIPVKIQIGATNEKPQPIVEEKPVEKPAVVVDEKPSHLQLV